jgi:hypothetical protein
MHREALTGFTIAAFELLHTHVVLLLLSNTTLWLLGACTVNTYQFSARADYADGRAHRCLHDEYALLMHSKSN